MHKPDKMFSVITKKAIIMIIPLFVQVTGSGLPSKLRFCKCDGTVRKACDTDALQLSLFISLLLSAI